MGAHRDLAAHVILLGALLALLVVLAAALAARRGWFREASAVESGGRNLPRTARVLVAALVLGAANAPLLHALAVRPVLSADLRSHAMVAREIALGRANHGWIDVYVGGFPLGPHYPSIAWLFSGALMRLGVSPASAVLWIGVTAVLATHALVLVLAVRAGASFSSALAGAAAVSWVAPFTGFLGGAQAILVLGLLAQVVAAPFALATGYCVLFGKSTRALAVCATFAMLAHPQLALAASALLLIAAVMRGRTALRRWLFAAGVQGVAGAAVFGPGLASLGVPFGWPPMEAWRIRGRPAGELMTYFANGFVLDFDRAPVVTTALAAALVVLVAAGRRRESRESVVATVAIVGLATSGEALSRAGRVGALVLSFLQPLRVYAFVPIVAGAVIVAALFVAESWVARIPWRAAVPLRARRAAKLAPAILLLAWVGHASLPQAARSMRERAAFVAAGPCGPSTPRGFDERALAAALGALHEGRLYYDGARFLACGALTGIDFASSVPIGAPHSVGGHVGVLAQAFNAVAPASPGGAERADAMAVGSVMHDASEPLEPAEAWRERARVGDIVVSERATGTSYFGAGCITEAWRGSDDALRAELFAAIDRADPAIYGATRFIALEQTSSAAIERETRGAGCDATQARVLSSRRLGPGEYDADVESPAAPFDVVLRATAYKSWRFEIDGVPAPFVRVAPGFMAVRVPRGAHHVTARAEREWRYLGLVIAALAFIAWATREAHRRGLLSTRV